MNLNAIEQTTDGGYILGGTSLSGISGDKTEIMIGGAEGEGDLWVIKLDFLGNIEWQNDIGGPSVDVLKTIHQTADGGYIVGANSRSNSGGDKTENGVGDEDFWILKLTSGGSIVWQQTIGGSSREYLRSTEQTSEGGYILGGFSRSGISGDKTEYSDVYYDYWVLKLNSIGDIEWQNTIGGERTDQLYSIKQIVNGNYIIAGNSNSTISGDKTESYKGAIRNDDFWIIYLNSIGGIVWQKTIGGTLSDNPEMMVQNEWNYCNRSMQRGP